MKKKDDLVLFTYSGKIIKYLIMTLFDFTLFCILNYMNCFFINFNYEQKLLINLICFNVGIYDNLRV